MGQRNIVEARQSDLLGHGDTPLGKGTQAADSHGVVERKYGIGKRIVSQQFDPGGVAAGFGKRAGQRPQATVAVARRFHTAKPPLLGIEVVGRSADDTDLPMPFGKQVRHHLPGAGAVVQIDLGIETATAAAVDDNRRQWRRNMRLQGVDSDERRHDNHAIHSPLHGAQHGGHLVEFVVGTRYQHVQAQTPCAGVDAAHQFGEEFAVHIRQHDTDGIGALGHQAARGEVGRVAQTPGRGGDFLPGRLRHGIVVKHARYRGDRHARFFRHIVHGSHNHCLFTLPASR